MIQPHPWLQWLVLMDCFVVVQVPISTPPKRDSRRQIQGQKLQQHTHIKVVDQQ